MLKHMCINKTSTAESMPGTQLSLCFLKAVICKLYIFKNLTTDKHESLMTNREKPPHKYSNLLGVVVAGL